MVLKYRAMRKIKVEDISSIIFNQLENISIEYANNIADFLLLCRLSSNSIKEYDNYLIATKIKVKSKINERFNSKQISRNKK